MTRRSDFDISHSKENFLFAIVPLICLLVKLGSTHLKKKIEIDCQLTYQNISRLLVKLYDLESGYLNKTTESIFLFRFLHRIYSFSTNLFSLNSRFIQSNTIKVYLRNLFLLL